MTCIAVCISTFRRPTGLSRLLKSLSKLNFPRFSNPDVRIVVIDNDSEATARDVVQRESAAMPWPVLYAIEPQRGIPFARNKAVALAGDVDFVAFIDDDEEANPLWLDELLDVQHKYQAAIVLGPVTPIFACAVPDWLVQSRAMEYHPRLATGSKPCWFFTGNVLVERAVLHQLDGPFDTRLALTGGSDAHLFKRLVMLGACSVWANEAQVTEHIPPSRATLRWLLCRAYSIGSNLSYIEKSTTTSALWPLKVLLYSFADQGWGILTLVPSLCLGRYRIVRSLWYATIGLGMLAGLAGFRYEEYRQIHGN